MSRVKEGVKFAHPSLHDLLDLIELDYKTFMSKVEKYTKPNLLVAEKVVAVKVVAATEREIIPSANLSSDYRHKMSDRNRDYERNCFGCGSNKHFLRDCDRKGDLYDRRHRERDQQQPEVSHKKSKNILESPLVAGVLRRRRPGDEVAINKQKFKRPFMNEDGEWISD
jgi:hypothetical protein